MKVKNSIVIRDIHVIKKGYVAVTSDVAFFSVSIFIIFAQKIKTMEYFIYFVVAILMLLSFIGCVLPAIPGPPLAFIGYLLLLLTPAGTGLSTGAIILFGVLTLLTIVVDFVIPALGVKFFGGTKWGKWGCFIGSIAGLLFMPWGLIIGPFLGAFIGELLGNNTTNAALMSGIGSLLGFLFVTVFKIGVTVALIYSSFAAIFSCLNPFQ